MTSAETVVLPATDADWPVLEWLWQAFAHDLSEFRDSLPGPDGRFGHSRLDEARGRDPAYLAWWGDRPVGFSLVHAGERGEWHMMAFLAVRRVRRAGVGRDLALETIRRHPGPWEIAFQEENPGAARFWRGLAGAAFPDGWQEETRQNPAKPHVAPDVWIIGTS